MERHLEFDPEFMDIQSCKLHSEAENMIKVIIDSEKISRFHFTTILMLIGLKTFPTL